MRVIQVERSVKTIKLHHTPPPADQVYQKQSREPIPREKQAIREPRARVAANPLRAHARENVLE
ncbi:MAG: hypothetical protein DRP42_02715 [Tenericutes bacterium]|nr:MAG: hypothetical protein DRP42_02715 [Mycoplasmatota bacterium]